MRNFLSGAFSDRGRINNVAFDPFRLQHSVDPETIETSLLDAERTWLTSEWLPKYAPS